jgi:N-hydroxyarylamine O-acetyltransferase
MIDLDAYCERIGWTGPRAPTLDVLSGLCLGHTSNVPFENLDILLGQPINLDVASVADKIVNRHRGGYCFEQNTLFQSVLSYLGFRVTPLGARVRLGVPPDVPTPRTHMLLRVDLDDGSYIADVGFGFTPTGPLRLEPGSEQPLHLNTYRLARQSSQWTLEILQPEGFTPAYVFTEEPCLLVDYEVANHFTSTHPRSFFTQGPLVMRHDPEHGVRHVLRGREWSIRRRADVETHPVTTSEHALHILAEHFKLDFPAGTLFRGLKAH